MAHIFHRKLIIPDQSAYGERAGVGVGKYGNIENSKALNRVLL